RLWHDLRLRLGWRALRRRARRRGRPADGTVAGQAAAIFLAARGTEPARRFLGGDGRRARLRAGDSGADRTRTARAADAALSGARPVPGSAGNAARLRAAGLWTAILSNGSPEMLSAAVENAGLVGLFDHV